MDNNKIEDAVLMLLNAIGEDPLREGLIDTPKRVAKMYAEIFAGLNQDPREHLEVFFNADGHKEVVIVKDITFHSCCEHHFVPFYGKAHIAYLPNKKLTGLSKLARVVDTISRRPQLQERITAQIADALEAALEPQGVYIIIEAEHLCMSMRGIKKPGAKTITTVARGVYAHDASLRAEIIALMKY